MFLNNFLINNCVNILITTIFILLIQLKRFQIIKELHSLKGDDSFDFQVQSLLLLYIYIFL